MVQAIQQRIDRDVSRRLFLGGAAALLAPFREAGGQTPSPGPAASAPRPILPTNLRLFDGAIASIREGVAIRIEGNLIAALPGAGEAPGEARVIDCGGRLAMPGLIDSHWHTTLCAVPQVVALTADAPYIHIAAAREAEVLRRVREQLMLGASQIKLMAGGGVASPYDPLDSIQYTEAELRAGVAAAADWGTYVMTHVYTPPGIQRAIRAGVKSLNDRFLDLFFIRAAELLPRVRAKSGAADVEGRSSVVWPRVKGKRGVLCPEDCYQTGGDNKANASRTSVVAGVLDFRADTPEISVSASSDQRDLFDAGAWSRTDRRSATTAIRASCSSGRLLERQSRDQASSTTSSAAASATKAMPFSTGTARSGSRSSSRRVIPARTTTSRSLIAPSSAARGALAPEPDA